jgi:hypothetical protein
MYEKNENSQHSGNGRISRFTEALGERFGECSGEIIDETRCIR